MLNYELNIQTGEGDNLKSLHPKLRNDKHSHEIDITLPK